MDQSLLLCALWALGVACGALGLKFGSDLIWWMRERRMTAAYRARQAATDAHGDGRW